MKLILTAESHYGLDLHVDMHAFDELMIYYRGATKRRFHRRDARKLYLFKEEYDVPIFQRLFVLFKLKPFEQRVDDAEDRDVEADTDPENRDRERGEQRRALQAPSRILQVLNQQGHARRPPRQAALMAEVQGLCHGDLAC